MAQATFSWPFGPIHLESACLRFRLTAKTAPAPLFLLFPANPLRWASPGVTMDWEKRHRGRMRACRISGAQNLSGFLRLHPGHWALAVPKLRLVRFHGCAWLCRAGDSWFLDAGRSGTGPYAKNVPASLFAVGAAPCGRPQWRGFPSAGCDDSARRSESPQRNAVGDPDPPVRFQTDVGATLAVARAGCGIRFRSPS